jgi:acetyltransferase-like isoleucine patch superfamily enzyme
MNNMINDIIAYLRGYVLRAKVRANGPIKSIGKTIINNRHGIISVGKRTSIWPDVKFSLIKSREDLIPTLQIGEYGSIGDRTQIHCGNRVEIGNYVLISWDVNIIEYDYHAPGGGLPEPLPIIIEEEAWIGARCIITKGVTIGKGSIIGAGSVVTKSIPPYSLAAGNPAKVIKQVQSWRGSSSDNVKTS